MRVRIFSKWQAGLFAGLLVLTTARGQEAPSEEPGADETPTSRSSRKSGSADRLRWNMKTLTDAYLRSGHRDAKWDNAATNALTLFARMRSGYSTVAQTRNDLANACRQAVSNGCADALVLYLHVRYVLANQSSNEELAQAYREAADAASLSPCPDLRHFFICLRTSLAVNAATGGRGTSGEVHVFRRRALPLLLRALEEPGVPPVEAEEACRELLKAVSGNPAQHQGFYRALEPILVKKWPDQAFIYLLKGEFEIKEAWRARGIGFADAVTKEGSQRFDEHLTQAAQALEQAWKLDPSDPRIAVEMLTIETGQGQGRQRMELWFERAMTLDPWNYAACSRKRNYLHPKWHGSAAQMLAFARECVASTKWGGRVPLILVEAHEHLAAFPNRDNYTNYWKHPRVWADLRSAYEKYFSVYPNAIERRHKYAKHAYLCERWAEFNKQIEFFPATTNYTDFGGREAFEQMVKISREKASKPARNPP